MPALSVNILTKDQVGPTLRALQSLENLVRPCDEILVLDTGSSQQNLALLEDALDQLRARFEGVAIRLVADDLAEDFAPYIERWLPDFAGQFETDDQYADCRGILDFAEARNIAMKASRHDAIFWLDSDDVLEEPEPGKTREMIDKAMDHGGYHGVFLDYHYAFAQDGTLTTVLKRERAIDRRELVWKGRCHETTVDRPGRHAKLVFCEDTGCVIRHTKARKPHRISDIRNYVVLKKEMEQVAEAGAAQDPRTLFYFANAARGLSRHAEALELYREFIDVSGSVDDRYAAALSMADIFMHPQVRRPVDGLDAFRKATEIKPLDPRGWFGMSRAYLAQERTREAIHFYSVGIRLPEPQTAHSYDPCSVHYFPHLVAAEAGQRLERHDFAVECARKAAEFRPDWPEAKAFLENAERRAGGASLADAIRHVGAHVKGGGPNARRVIRRVLDELPATPEEAETAGLGRKESPDPRPKRPAVAIYCGHTGEAWGPKSAETGIGGSEKMVLLMAPALQARGFNVTVYANTPYGQRGVHANGVRWSHWSECDFDPRRRALVAWRGHHHVLLPVSADQRWLWLHDVQNPADYGPDFVGAVDLVIAQSQFHAEPIRAALGDKLWVARNAIEVRDWADVPRDPKKVVYMSCPTRGATTALRMIEAAQKRDPEINMTLMYGFSPYERKIRVQADHRHIPDLGRDACVDDYERYLGRLVDATGARLLNRVSFERVWEELCSAGIWLYPTQFPEISCMAAMEAQAAGLCCVTSKYAALEETLLPESDVLGADLGPIERTDRYIEGGAEVLLALSGLDADHGTRRTQADAAARAFDIETLADEWAARLGGL